MAYDHLGDGCKVHYPIRISSKLKWSPIVYEKENNGVLVKKPRTFTEVIAVHVVKGVASFFFVFVLYMY